jgi:quaternary ammonium compound-resistance protein SugE
MSWILLIIAGLFEVGWAMGLKQAEGFTRFWPTVATIISMVLSLGFLGLALRSIPLSTGYAVWTGIGILGTAILGIAVFNESMDLTKLASIGLIICGIVGLKLVAQ